MRPIPNFAGLKYTSGDLYTMQQLKVHPLHTEPHEPYAQMSLRAESVARTPLARLRHPMRRCGLRPFSIEI